MDYFMMGLAHLQMIEKSTLPSTSVGYLSGISCARINISVSSLESSILGGSR